MAKFEDPLQQNLDFTPDEVTEEPATEEVQAQAQEEQVEEPAVQEQPELPAKYRGKTFEDVVKMHQELEKLNGKQAQEVGEHRKFFDEWAKRELLQSRAQQPKQEEQEDPDNKFFKSPTKSMDEYINNHPTIKEAQQQSLLMKAQTAQQQLQQQFPDYVQVVKNEKFLQWVESSPIRQQLYQEADANYDVTAAAELISTWKALSNVNQQKTQSTITPESQESRTKSLKAAAVDTGAPGMGSKKRYSRQALQDLLRTNPEKYYANADEILLAYDEGRVY